MSRTSANDGPFWQRIGPFISVLEDLKNCELEKEEAEDVCRCLDLEWFESNPLASHPL